MRNRRYFLSVPALLAVLGSPVAHAQDRCFNAIPIGTGTTIGNNLSATTGGDPVCPASAGKDVWYSYIVPCNGNVTVDTCGAATNFDTVLSVFDGNCGCNALVRLTCNDQFCGNSSSVTFTAVQGVQYFFSVAGWLNASGTFALTVSPCVPGVPVNDSCGGTFIPVGYRVVGHNFGATTAGLPNFCTTSAGNVWYFITPPQSGGITFTTCNLYVGAGTTNFDTVLHLIGSFCGEGSAGCNDDSCGSLQSFAQYAAVGGVTYLIQPS